MKRTGALLALAVFAVLGLVYWVATQTHWETVTERAPLKGEAATDPDYALKRLAHALGAQAHVLEAGNRLPPGDATLLIRAPWWEMFHDQEARIREWVEAGGHLVIDATVASDSVWSWIDVDIKDLREEEGEEADEDAQGGARNNEPQRSASPQSSKRVPAPWERVIDTSQCAPSREWDPRTGLEGRAFPDCWPQRAYLAHAGTPIWALHRKQGPPALRIQRGAGRVTAFLPRPFTGDTLLRDDLAHYFVLVSDLRPGTQLWLYPQTSSDSLPARVWLEAGAVVVLLALGILLALWRAIPRFGPLAAAPVMTRRALSEQIIGSGEFVHRAGHGETLLRAQRAALHQAARRRLRGYDALPAEERVRAVAALCGLDGAALRRAMLDALGDYEPVEPHLQILEQARRQLRARTSPFTTRPKTPS